MGSPPNLFSRSSCNVELTGCAGLSGRLDVRTRTQAPKRLLTFGTKAVRRAVRPTAPIARWSGPPRPPRPSASSAGPSACPTAPSDPTMRFRAPHYEFNFFFLSQIFTQEVPVYLSSKFTAQQFS
jgi:hypothetical protein